jgi:RNA polymerase sigma factor (sigma-70 family)
MNDDAQILRRYAEHGAEDAFRELVDRHLPLVYSTALRVVAGDVHLAEDVSQRVFADVARKARTLARHASLAGWLHRHATYTASKVVRTERRRTAREQEAVSMSIPGENDGAGVDWTQVEPHLDQALDALGRADREAVVLRFLQRRDLRSVGQSLGCSEDAAQKRVTRAVDKLRRFLERRGVTLSAAGLSALLGSHATAAVPVGLVASVSTGAMAAAATGVGVAGASIISTLTSLMTTEKLTTATVSTLLIAGLGTPLALQHRTNRNLEAENLALREQVLIRQMPALNPAAGLQVEADEIDRLRRENAELHRLRGEVALLRNQKQEVERMAAETAEARRELNQMARQMAEAQAAPSTPEQQQFFRTGLDRMNLSKQWMLAIHLYADAQGGMVPARLSDAAPYFDAGDEPIEGLSADDLEIVYTGRLDEIPEPIWARTIVLREREPRPAPDGKWTRTYGFADGHSEIRSQATPDFSAWERERMVVH